MYSSQRAINYRRLPDREIARRAQYGDHDAVEHLIGRYRYMARAFAGAYYLVGFERDDLLQIVTLGLWRAIMEYPCEKSGPFPKFAQIVIRRHIIAAIRTATTQKYKPLNCALSLEAPLSETTHSTLLGDLLKGPNSNDPLEILIRKEDSKRLTEALDAMLSDLERNALAGFLQGKTYREIAAESACKPKHIDNALARVRRKALLMAPSEFE